MQGARGAGARVNSLYKTTAEECISGVEGIYTIVQYGHGKASCGDGRHCTMTSRPGLSIYQVECSSPRTQVDQCWSSLALLAHTKAGSTMCHVCTVLYIYPAQQQAHPTQLPATSSQSKFKSRNNERWQSPRPPVPVCAVIPSRL